jgi:putative redox protein
VRLVTEAAGAGAGADRGPDLGLVVRHQGADRFEIAMRQHVVTVDQPFPAREEAGPTPTELFIASVASCVAFYAARYLVRHGFPAEGLAVHAEYDLAARPSRVARIALRLTVPEGVPEDRHPALLAVASHCTVHNSLEQPPEVVIEMTQP